jgi:ethanolamine utilization protein EutA (predicted chaperonin)
MAALGALLAAAVFGAVAITKHNVDNRPLVAKLSGVRAISAGIKISGSVINRSDKIYGVPNLMIIAKDDKGNILSAHKIPAIATLIEAHSHLDFQHDLIGNFTGATLIDVEMAE